MKIALYAKLYAHPNIFDEKYLKRDNSYSYIGIPFAKEKLMQDYNLTLSKEPIEIFEGVKTTGQIPRSSECELVPDKFQLKKDDKYIKDEILDDQALILETSKGIWVVLGCTHSGIINTLSYVSEITGESKITGIIGGTHLKDADELRLKETVEVLNEFKVQKIVLSHCTGIDAYIYLSNKLGHHKVFLNSAGTVLKI